MSKIKKNKKRVNFIITVGVVVVVVVCVCVRERERERLKDSEWGGEIK